LAAQTLQDSFKKAQKQAYFLSSKLKFARILRDFSGEIY